MTVGPLEVLPPPPPPVDSKGSSSPAIGRTEPSARVGASAVAARRIGESSDSSFDAAKVARVAQAIRDGRFVVDAGVIADRLIGNARALLPRGADLT